MTDPDTSPLEITVLGDSGEDLGTSVWGPGVTNPFKNGLTLNAALFTGASLVVIAGGSIIAPVSVGAIIIGTAFGLGGVGLGYWAATDPPQTDYKRPARVNRLSVSLPDKDELPGAQPLMDTLNDLIPLTNGLVDASERFEGAQIAKDKRWEVGHAHGAQLLLACSLAKHVQLAGRLERFRNEKLDVVTLDQSNYDSIKIKAQAHDLLPAEATSVLLRGGLSEDDLSAFERMVAEYSMNELPTGNFKDATTDLSGQLRTETLKMIAEL